MTESTKGPAVRRYRAFEIASDGPGFAVDEPEATLGEKIVLPPFLESHRAEIVSNLKPID